jgi:hypothetical protein
MNLFTKIFLTLLPFSFLHSQDCNSKLFIETDINPVNILINDSLVCEALNYSTELPDGFYKIAVIENVDRYDAKMFIDTVELKNCEEKKLVYSIEDKVYLDSSPQDAYVFSGDTLLGNTPLFVSKSIYELKLSKPQFEDKVLTNKYLLSNITVDLKFIGNHKEESFFYSTTFHVLAGTALVLGAASAYYKLKADNAFDDYQFTGNKEKLDETEKYDIVSGITFTALQINFGYILYRFLTE